MFRVVCTVAAIFAVTAVSTAQAQPNVCRKVDVSFACRNGGSGTATFDCRKGESKARCCARLRNRAADPRRGWCTGRNGGLISFKCGCSKKGGGEGLAPLRRLAPPRSDAKPAQPDRPEKIKTGPLGRRKGPARAGACRQVKYKFSCRRRGGAEGKAACRRGENKAACCHRVRRLARESCAPNGGVARFKCDCGRGGGAGRGLRRGLRDGERLRLGRESDGDEHTPPARPLRRLRRDDDRRGRAGRCRKVTYAFSCRREGGASGRSDCRSGNKRRCCARMRRLAAESCGRSGGVARFQCDCARGRRGGGRLPDQPRKMQR